MQKTAKCHYHILIKLKVNIYYLLYKKHINLLVNKNKNKNNSRNSKV